MSTVLNLVALGAVGAFVLGKVKLKTALMVGIGAILLAQVLPAPTTTSPQQT